MHKKNYTVLNNCQYNMGFTKFNLIFNCQSNALEIINHIKKKI